MRLLAVIACACLLAVPLARASEPSPDPAPVLLDGKTPEQWRAEAQRMRQLAYKRLLRVRGLEATLRRDPQVSEAINLASRAYGVSRSTLWRKAKCESRLYPRAYNASGASGLFQFLPSTWRSTPFAAFSIWSPYANALAAAWMHRVGRSGEWVCR